MAALVADGSGSSEALNFRVASWTGRGAATGCDSIVGGDKTREVRRQRGLLGWCAKSGSHKRAENIFRQLKLTL
jgi:hypothetical protein